MLEFLGWIGVIVLFMLFLYNYGARKKFEKLLIENGNLLGLKITLYHGLFRIQKGKIYNNGTNFVLTFEEFLLKLKEKKEKK